MGLTQSETRKQATFRPEQTVLVDFLGQFGVKAYVEYKIPIDNWFFCNVHGAFRNHDLCPKCHALWPYMCYYLDVYIPKIRTEIAINGKEHERKGRQKHDSERFEYLKSKGIDSIPFPKSMFIDSKGVPKYDDIESFARLVSKIAS